MNTGNKIREIRKNKGLSMKVLGQMIGVSEQAISQYERGLRNINLETLFKISNALNIPLKSICSPDIGDMEKLPNNKGGELLKNIYNDLINKEYSNPDEVGNIIDMNIDKLLEENMPEYKESRKYVNLLNKIKEIDDIFNYLEETSSKLKSLNLSKSDFQSLILLEKLWRSTKNGYLPKTESPNLFYTEGYVTGYLDSIKFLKSTLEELKNDYL